MSPAQFVTVTNTGSAPLTLATPVLGGDAPGDFIVTPPLCKNLAPGAGCTVRVRFAPTTTGARTATLRLPSNGFGPAPEVALRGVGAAPRISAVPLAMGNLRVGQTVTKQFTITNSGDASLHITAVQRPARPTSQPGWHLQRAVAPGSTCRIPVTFTAHARPGRRVRCSPSSVTLSTRRSPR